MRTGACVSSCLAGVAGLMLGYMAVARFGLGIYVDTLPEAWLRAIGVAIMGLLAVAGGLLARSHPKWSAWLNAVALLGGAVLVSFFWLLPGVLLLSAEVMLYLSTDERRRALRQP
ncbi:MAG: hypothetical protein K6U14_00950 [Firmicutes bacterium]|nr:hypothetical protein [Alicyclobacillaceae bacterium]MCL6496186.1 hypothetical protein [Bacillota bacterium]